MSALIPAHAGTGIWHRDPATDAALARADKRRRDTFNGLRGTLDTWVPGMALTERTAFLARGAASRARIYRRRALDTGI